jgi:signal transduction histidine kinase
MGRVDGADDRSIGAPSGAARQVERAAAAIFLGVRAVHVTQGALCWVSGRQAYKRQVLTAATTLAAIGEFAWLIDHYRRRGTHDEVAARVDTAFSSLGLIVLAASTESSDRTTSINWMMPLSVGSALGAAIGLAGLDGCVAVGTLAGTYSISVGSLLRRGGAPAATAVANIMSYPAFFAVGEVLVRVSRRMGRELDKLRTREIEQGAELATQRERNKAQRFIHDSALQTLEAIAHRQDLTLLQVRAAAGREALSLRGSLTSRAETELDLVDRLQQLAATGAGADLRVELVVSELREQPRPDVSTALHHATREALTNVAKHAGVGSAIVRVHTTQGGTRVTVRDHGRGFDTSTVEKGFGLRSSVAERVQEVGGTVAVSSAPGRGTKVELWAPN